LNFYYLSRPLLRTYRKALKLDGLLFFETFLWEPGIETNFDHYLQPGELEGFFGDWQIIQRADVEHPPTSSSQARRSAQLIARRTS
jgi:hypothetical protein